MRKMIKASSLSASCLIEESVFSANKAKIRVMLLFNGIKVTLFISFHGDTLDKR